MSYVTLNAATGARAVDRLIPMMSAVWKAYLVHLANTSHAGTEAEWMLIPTWSLPPQQHQIPAGANGCGQTACNQAQAALMLRLQQTGWMVTT
jgi:hypothetical protein